MGDGGSERPAGASQATDAASASEAPSSLADGTLDKVFHGFFCWHCRREEEQRIDNSRVAEQRKFFFFKKKVYSISQGRPFQQVNTGTKHAQKANDDGMNMGSTNTC